MIDFIPAKTEIYFQELSKLADIVWREYYIPIVGKPQVDYMLRKYQSAEAIRNQVSTGFEYFIITLKKKTVSYIAIKQEEDALFLSKIYVLNQHRGKAIGRAAVEFIEQKAKNYRLKTIRLHVNINNAEAIKVYHKLGFINVGSLNVSIGEGFFTDDFILEKKVYLNLESEQ